MRILTLSDLHVEFAPFRPPQEAIDGADLVVLAGDIHKGVQGLVWARQTFGDRLPVVYVAGNHEYYGGHWTQTLEAMRRAAQDLGIHLLEDEAVVVGGVRVLGCTLWADFRYLGDEMRSRSERDYALGLMDCRRIKADPVPGVYWQSNKHRLTPLQVRLRSAQSLGWLESQLQDGAPQSTVVVTHHLPHRLSVAPQFVTDHLTPGFVTLVPEEFIQRARLWIHGHTHESADYWLGGTRVVCNPRGYPLGPGGMRFENLRFENSRFDAGLVVEV